MRYMVALFLSLLVLTLAGCGLASKAAEKATEKAVEKAVEQATGVKVDSAGNSMTIKGADGKEMTITGADDGKLPEGFPLPVYQGGKAVFSAVMATDGKKSWTAELEFSADPKTVADYYEKVLKDRGMEVTRTESTSDGLVDIFLMADSEKEGAWISVSKPPDSPTRLNMIFGHE